MKTDIIWNKGRHILQTRRLNPRTNSFDICLVFLVVVLTFCGLLVIFSATRSAGDDRKLIVQSIATGLGFSLMYLMARVDFRNFKRYVNLIYVACLIILAGVLLFGVGKKKPVQTAGFVFLASVFSHLNQLKLLFPLS